MATEGCKELLSSGSQPENVEYDLYNDVNIMATSLPSEKNGTAFQTALEDDEKAEEVNANAVPEISTTLVDGHERAYELGGNDVENDNKVEAVNSSSNKETKKIVRKRKKNTEDASGHSVISPPKAAKKKINDVSATKMKDVPPGDKPMEGNAKKDGKLESTGKSAITEDEVEKSDGQDVETGKVEGTVNKAVKIVKKKIAAKAKGGSSNAELASTKSPKVSAVESTSSIDENAKQNLKIDENLAASTEIAIGAIEEDAEGTKDKSTPSATEEHLKKDDTAEKQVQKVDGMGLIFMCNAKTKKDCFKYNIFGLPEGKKALVAKVYKGMRLFLFDFDLKLLYGIYKADGPGGYNIEPKAFDSKFPSQVRFTVLKDCLPLPEEKFKAAIKENYIRNKFDCQLSQEQVRKLCKLFQSATGSASIQKHRPVAMREVTMPRSRTRAPRRRHVRREAYPSPPPRARRLSPRRLSPPPQARYLSPPRVLPLQTLPRALPVSQLPPYTYERPVDDYYYQRDNRRALDLEMRPRVLPIDYHDSYNLYREPVLYREPAYPLNLPPAYTARLREPRSPLRYLY